MPTSSGPAACEGAAPMISVRDLHVRAGNTVLLDEATFDVHAGRVLTLFGPSGAGKTTLAAALADATPSGLTVSGEIRRGDTVQIGYLPQDAAATLNPARRIGAVLGELVTLHQRSIGSGRVTRRRRRALVAQVLESVAFGTDGVALDRLLRTFPSEFSGGERVRLALAQVLTREPDVLIVDEPTVGLDPIARTILLAQLARLRRAGKAVVLTTRDPLVVARIGDHVLSVRNGRVTDGGHPVTVRETAHRPTRRRAEPVLEIRGVSVRVRNASVLRRVDLELYRGEFLGLVGVSGAGKSTLARCIAGLLAADSGRILVDGEPVPRLRKRTRAQIAAIQYVWRESAFSFDPRRRVVDQVTATAVRLRGLSRADAHTAALDMLLDLDIGPDQAARLPAGLSGGQLQRAALARALLAHPRILVCDELTAVLDRPRAARVLDYLDYYRSTHDTAILSIGPDLRSQLDRADRIAVLDAGRIVDVGTPEGLRTHPRAPILRRLLDAEELASRGSDAGAGVWTPLTH